MSDLPAFVDQPASNNDREDFLRQSTQITDSLFGEVVSSNQIRAVFELCDLSMRYFKVGRTVVRAGEDLYSTIDIVFFEPKEEPSDESDKEELIVSRTSGVITSYDIDTFSKEIKISRGFGKLALNAIGEVELELEDTLDADEVEDDPELCEVLQPNTLYVSDLFLLLDVGASLKR